MDFEAAKSDDRVAIVIDRVGNLCAHEGVWFDDLAERELSGCIECNELCKSLVIGLELLG